MVGVEVMFALVAVVIVVAIVAAVAKGISQWASNNSKPVLSESTRIVAKRSMTRGMVSANTGGQVTTSYFVTFELPSGERREFEVNSRSYGQFAEEDNGTLTYQGTRYKGFERKR